MKRFPQFTHSFLRRVVLSGESRVSKVLNSSDPQYGHFTDDHTWLIVDSSKQPTLIVVYYLVIVYIENEINWYLTIENIHN